MPNEISFDSRMLAPLLWLALASCRQSPVENPPPDATPAVLEPEQTLTEHWLDLDIADDGHRSMGCAVDKLGALWCWGEDPTFQRRLRPLFGPEKELEREHERRSPTRVEGVDSARAVSLADNAVCRVDADGRVHCISMFAKTWEAIEGVTAAQDVMVADWGGCAIERDRTLRCWKDNAPARALAQDVLAFTTNDYYTCALRPDGAVSCWEEGQLESSHGHVVDAIDIALDGSSSVRVLTSDGRVMADELGDGKTEWVERGSLPEAVEFDVSNHGVERNQCGRTANGAVQCRGYNVYGQLGGGHSQKTSEPVTMLLGADQRALEVAVGEGRTCVRTAKEILCVGLDASAWDPLPGTVHQHKVEVEAVSLAAAQRAATCAMDRAGDLRCWGADPDRNAFHGIEGVATPTIRARGGKALVGVYTTMELPSALYFVVDGRLDGTWIGDPAHADQFFMPEVQTEIHAITGNKYACMIESSARGRVATCGNTLAWDRPKIGGVEGPTSIATLDSAVCAIDRLGRAMCSPSWLGSDGEPVATAISGVKSARSIAAGRNGDAVQMCAVLESDRVMCWFADVWNPPAATDVGLSNVAAIVGTASGFCSLDRAGAVSCWLPDGDHVQPMPGPTIDAEVVQLVGGITHSCALDRAGVVTCWGSEHYGQLGRVPAAVSLQPTALVFGP